jgi:HEAT repeat protein
LRGRCRYLALAVLALQACSSNEPLDRLIAQLGQPSVREQAIDGLLVLVRKSSAKRRPEVRTRVVHALMEAYRDDVGRGQIVSALALLRDPAAEEVFVAALKDADRGGAYFEAAVRSARVIGELELKSQVPALVTALEQALRSPRQDRNTWLERSLVGALERLGDPRAVPVLMRALKADPGKLDFYVSRLAAQALGNLRDGRAVDQLVASLGATRHGLLLYEPSRQALCRIGPPAIKGLLAAATAKGKHGRRQVNAAAATRVLGDLGAREVAPTLASGLRPEDTTEYRLAVAETLLRLANDEGRRQVEDLLRNNKANVTARRRGAELLGWYGRPDAVVPLLKPTCQERGPAQEILCWSVALAVTRLAARGGLEQLDRLLSTKQDPQDKVTRHYLEMYRARLKAVETCQDDPSCYVRQLSDAVDWRVVERAALELGRAGQGGAALARRLPEAHPEVQRAILVSLERMELSDADRREAVAQLERLLAPPKAQAKRRTPEAILSRALCLAERLKREPGPGTNNGEKR